MEDINLSFTVSPVTGPVINSLCKIITLEPLGPAAKVPPLSGDFSGEMNQHKYLKPSARGAKGTDSNSSQL